MSRALRAVYAATLSTAMLSFLCLPLASRAQSSDPAPDPTDSGYTSSFLANLDRTNTTEEENARARMEVIRETRGSDPTFASRVLDQANLQRQLYSNLLPGAGALAGVPTWISIGPTKTNHIQNEISLNASDSGRLRTILPHPTNPDIAYVLTCCGGLWKTTNFTQNKPTWTAKTDDLSTTSGGAAAFGHNPDTIYLGLGDPFEGNGLTGGVMLKSTDGGDHWGNIVGLPTASFVLDVKVETVNGHDIVLVGTDIGLYVSNDEGASYRLATDAALLQPSPFGTLPRTVWSIVKTSQGLVASTETLFFTPPTPIDGTGGIVISRDHGATWQSVTTLSETFTGKDANGNPVSTTVLHGRTTLGVGLPVDSVVYAFAANKGDRAQLDLFRSADGGQTWTALGLPGKTPINPNHDQPNMDIMEGQAFYNQMVLIDPTDSKRNTVYIGGQLSSAKSTDGGATWTVISNWLAQFGLPYVHADFHAAAFSNVGKNSLLLFGSDGGLFLSDDGGRTFADKHNDGLVTTIGYTIQSNPTHPASTIVGNQDNGTFVRWGNNDIWEQPLGGDGIGVGWSQATDAIALGSFEFSVIDSNDKRDPSKQNHWLLAINGINRRFATFFTSIATPSAIADQTGLNFFTYTSRQIYRTANGGESWTDIGHTTIPGRNPGDPSTPPSPGIGATRIFRDTPHGVGVSPTPTGLNHVAVVCNGGFLVFTHDGGTTWNQTGLIPPVPNPSGLGVPEWAGFNATVEWADNNTLYVGSESPIPSSRVAKSTDGGLHFVRSDSGLPDVPVNRILVSPTDKNTVYAATFLGVYRSTDGGAHWSRFGAGLPFVEVRDLYMPPDGSFLRIASYGRGNWEIHP
jgi:photosystem II stability/assembly factor-like uncharacterized protein